MTIVSAPASGRRLPLAAIIGGIAVAAAIAASPAAGAVLDQSQFTLNQGMPFAFGPSFANTGVGQSYTAGITGTLATIGVYCNGPCNLNGGTSTIEMSVSGPGLLGSTSFTTGLGVFDSYFPGYYAMIFDFSSLDIEQVAGTQYTFSFAQPTGDGDLAYRGIVLANNNPYAGGGATPTAGYGATPDWDLMFRTEVIVAGGVPEPASWAMLITGFGLTGAAMRRRAMQGRAIQGRAIRAA